MKDVEVRGILDKYLDGETSEQEERMLQYYFLYEDVNPDFEQYKVLFAAFLTESREVSGKDFQAPFATNKIVSFTNYKVWFATAASVIILITSWFAFYEGSSVQDIPSKKELLLAQKYLTIGFASYGKAYEQTSSVMEKASVLQSQTKSALELTSSVYKKHTKEIDKLNYIDQSFNKLQSVKSMSKSRIKMMM